MCYHLHHGDGGRLAVAVVLLFYSFLLLVSCWLCCWNLIAYFCFILLHFLLSYLNIKKIEKINKIFRNCCCQVRDSPADWSVGQNSHIPAVGSCRHFKMMPNASIFGYSVTFGTLSGLDRLFASGSNICKNRDFGKPPW